MSVETMYIPQTNEEQDAASACAELSTEDMFGPVGEKSEERKEREAYVIRNFCATCPLRHSCLMESIQKEEYKGVWGGTTEYYRSKFLRGKINLQQLVLRSFQAAGFSVEIPQQRSAPAEELVPETLESAA